MGEDIKVENDGDDKKQQSSLLPNPNTPKSYKDLIFNKASQLEKKERKFLNFEASSAPGILAVASGLVINSQLKKSVMVYEGLAMSGAATGLSAFMSTVGLRKILIEHPLHSGTLDCPSCAATRGGLLQAFTSTFVPLLASICANAIVGERYAAEQISEVASARGRKIFQFWYQKIRPFRGTIWISVLVNAAFGAYLTYRQEAIVSKVHQSVTDDEMRQVFAHSWNLAEGYVK